ncbi:MAG TPA: ABC transporter permease [Tepidisphaeraceae bacterium]|nr:ABC transporter permease [Tepidisphaeraceae bacterium]
MHVAAPMFNFLVETFLLGLKNLHLHKLRSLLTALGIIIGVMAVIVMVAIGEGAKQTARAQMEQLGATNIMVRSVKPPESNDASQKTQRVLTYGLKREDVKRLKEIPHVKTVVSLRDTEQKVIRDHVRATANAMGTTPDAFSVMRLSLERGRYFTEYEYEADPPAQVCVIGSEAARQLFPFADPLGETVMIGTPGRGTVMLTVVGVLAPTGLSAESAAGKFVERNLDQDVYFPLSLAEDTFSDNISKPVPGGFERKLIELSDVWLQVDDVKHVEDVAGIVENVVKTAHGNVADVEVKAPIQILRQAERLNRVFNFVMVGIASFSLVVGGIGIMNIMLATVTERTKEIGIRRALGAKRKHIILQFLIETTVISLTGGLIGIGLGVGGAKLIPLLADGGDYRTAVTTWSVLGSFIVSGAIGIGFGLYPAYKAAQMNPIDALRHA